MEGSLPTAAKRRLITLPAFSRRIKAFEQWLGKPVLERGPNRVQIAPALRDNEAELRALLSRVEELRTRLKHHDPASTTITLAAQHAAIPATFAQMASRARRSLPNIRFRLQAGNQSDCFSMFVRQDANILMIYEMQSASPYSFDDRVKRTSLRTDQLVLVAGPALAATVNEAGELSADTPAIVFPTGSYFGSLLTELRKPFSTRERSANPVVDSAFTMGIKDWVLEGIGVAWLPLSLTSHEIQSGQLIDLSERYKRVDLEIVLYWRTPQPAIEALVRLWSGHANILPLSAQPG